MFGVVLQKVARLGPKAIHVGADIDAANFDLRARADLVLEVGVDDRPALDLDQLDQRAQPAANGFQHRSGDVLPKIVGLNLEDQLQFLRDHRHIGDFLEQPGDGDDLVAKAAKAGSARKSASCVRRIRRSNSFAARSSSSSALGSPATCSMSSSLSFAPSFDQISLFSEFLDVAALRPDDEIVDAHRQNFVAQPVGDIAAQLSMLGLDVDRGARLAGVRDRRRGLPIVARASLRLDRLEVLVDLADELARARRRGACSSEFACRAIGEFGVLIEELEILAEIEDEEEFLVPARARTGRGTAAFRGPSICQNFVFERTILKKTRLTTSGTSMPVSSMSTEMAMCGAFSGCEKSSISDWAYSVLKSITRANDPLRCG